MAFEIGGEGIRSMRCAIYAKVSLEDQLQQYKLASQFNHCRKYAEAHGYQIIGEFTDDISGSVIDRPALDRLRARVLKLEHGGCL